MQNYYDFLEKLYDYYKAFYKFCKEKNIGYQGVLYRESCQKIDDFLKKSNHKKFIFIGFNALNKAEEFLFQKVLELENAEIYWDLDQAFLEGNHQAGKFIRKYKQEWKYYEKNDLKLTTNHFSESKYIEIIGAPKNTTQLKYAGEILSTFDKFNDTALVLADETLLPITLNSLPKNIEAINITMGYPLKDIPVSHLIFSIFQLFISQEKLNKQQQHQFYYKDVIRVLKHEAIYQMLSKVDDFTAEVAKNNQTFLNENDIASVFDNLDESLKPTLQSIFKSFSSVNEFLERIINVIDSLKNDSTALEKEYFFRFYTLFNQLFTLQKQFNYFTDLKTVQQFLRQLISSENLSFQGEPLQGLQLMGMLETRVLDFENIILVATNEGILPAGNKQNSFIPFDVKLDFGLPTYREKDAIFSYHFFRLLQRAKNVYILYNTENDNFGNGEKSRFVTQLEMMRTDIIQNFVSPIVISSKSKLKKIKKDEETYQKLKVLAEKGISPSALTTYLYNPIAFYQQKVLGLKELEGVEETVAYNTLGNVVHNTLDDLYRPFLGKLITFDVIESMKNQSKDLVIHHFKNEFKNGDISTGKNRLIFEVANRFVTNFLKQEKKLVADTNNQLKILATEQNLETEIKIDGFDFPIKLHGQVDRVDELNGKLRIIDYKTGFVDASNLKVSDYENLRDEKHHKAIQVLLYTYIYTKSKNFDFSKNITAGIYSFKNLNKGFLQIDFSEPRRKPITQITSEKLEEFIIKIREYITEIYDLNILFEEPKDLKY